MQTLIGARVSQRALVLATAALILCGAIVEAQTAAAPDAGPVEASRALAAGDSGRAIALGTAWLERHPGHVGARILLARAHLDRDELDAAYTQLDRVLAAQPGHVDALYYFGLLTSQLAAKQFEALVTQAPESARARQLVAESLDAQDRRAEAEAAWEAALKANPDLLDALLGLAKLKRIRLDCDGAVALYTRAEAIRATFDGAYGLGTCYFRQQQLEAARTQFERAVARDPRAAVAHTGLASTLLALDRPADAVVRLRRAVALEPAMGEAWYLLGRALQTSGDRAGAQDAFARAEQLRTGAPPAAPRDPERPHPNPEPAR